MDNSVKVFCTLNDKNLLSFRVENDTSNNLIENDFLFKAKTFQANMKNAWTVIASGENQMKIVPFKGMGTRKLFFEFVSEEDTKRLIDFKNSIYTQDDSLVINKKFFAMGLGIFLDLDASEENLKSYIWRLKKGEHDKLDDSIKKILGEEYAVINDKEIFPFLHGELFEEIVESGGFSYIEKELQKAREEHDLNAIFSFLQGLWTAGYANITMHGIVFQIPTMKGLYLNNHIIIDLFNYLSTYFVFSFSLGSITQISSKDGLFEELMLMYAKNIVSDCDDAANFLEESQRRFMKYDKDISNGQMVLWEKYRKNINTKDALFSFLLDTLSLENKDFVESLKIRKLKIHTK